jgi:anti-sigma factor RsiW
MSDATNEDELIAKVSDYLDGTLAPDERADVGKKIAADAEWKRVHDELVDTRNKLSGMQKERASPKFASEVTDTIHKRSAGRFFARRTLGDRVPFGALLVVAVLVLAVVGYVMWSSQTGSLQVDRSHGGEASSGSGSLVPKP